MDATKDRKTYTHELIMKHINSFIYQIEQIHMDIMKYRDLVTVKKDYIVYCRSFRQCRQYREEVTNLNRYLQHDLPETIDNLEKYAELIHKIITKYNRCNDYISKKTLQSLLENKLTWLKQVNHDYLNNIVDIGTSDLFPDFIITAKKENLFNGRKMSASISMLQNIYVERYNDVLSALNAIDYLIELIL